VAAEAGCEGAVGAGELAELRIGVAEPDEHAAVDVVAGDFPAAVQRVEPQHGFGVLEPAGAPAERLADVAGGQRRCRAVAAPPHRP
jgi:hypothetical protein